MPDNQLITELLEAFRSIKRVKTAKELGILMGENANGFSDLQAGRKKLSIEHVINLKKSHPDFNVNWIINKEGSVFLERNHTHDAKGDQPTISKEERLISTLEKAVEGLNEQNLELIRTVRELTLKVSIPDSR